MLISRRLLHQLFFQAGQRVDNPSRRLKSGHKIVPHLAMINSGLALGG